MAAAVAAMIKLFMVWLLFCSPADNGSLAQSFLEFPSPM
jgi:hypothetical protein